MVKPPGGEMCTKTPTTKPRMQRQVGDLIFSNQMFELLNGQRSLVEFLLHPFTHICLDKTVSIATTPVWLEVLTVLPPL